MLSGRITTCDGRVYALPPLYTWQLRRTGGVPCDSFCVRCAWDAETMRGVLGRAVRFAALEDGRTAFCGVVDEYTAERSDEGSVLELSGRGMAALLLDNEAEPANYQCASADEILRRHALPCGVVCAPPPQARAGQYSVAAGTSEWRAVADFARLCGLTPYFSADGTLSLRDGGETERVALPREALSLSLCEKRYGVISEAVVLERGTGRRRVVRNEAFCALGGQCRRVLYAPAQSTAQTMRCTGEYQIAQSMRERFTLRALYPGHVAAEVGARTTFSAPGLGIAAEELTVYETTWSGGADGETTEVLLRKEE